MVCFSSRTILGSLWQEPCHLQGPEFVLTFNILPCSFVLSCSRLLQLHQFRSHSLCRIARTFSAPNQNFSLSVHSSFHIVSSQMSLSSVFQVLRQILRPCTFSKHFDLLTASSTSHTPLRSMLRFASFFCSCHLSTEIPQCFFTPKSLHFKLAQEPMTLSSRDSSL